MLRRPWGIRLGRRCWGGEVKQNFLDENWLSFRKLILFAVTGINAWQEQF